MKANGTISSMASRRGAWFAVAGRWLLGCAFLLTLGARAQSVDEGGPLQANPDTVTKKPIGNDAVIRMVKAELDESIILHTIQTQPGRYDLGPDQLIELKSAGVSQQVISAMQAKAAGLAVRPQEVRGVGGAPLTAMPDEVGVYYKDRQGEWIPLKIERVVFKSSGWLKNAATYGLVKQDMNGHLDGGKSPLKLPTGVQLLIYAPTGTEGEEYDFLRLREHKDSRDFRTLTGGLLHSESGSARDELQFDPKRVAPRTYTFTVPKDIVKGEYGMLPPGAANQRGFADTGKIYTFSISE